jgi:hypothetical protein
MSMTMEYKAAMEQELLVVSDPARTTTGKPLVQTLEEIYEAAMTPGAAEGGAEGEGVSPVPQEPGIPTPPDPYGAFPARRG